MAESIEVAASFGELRHPSFLSGRGRRPTIHEWIRHTALFVLTALTTTVAGVLLASTDVPALVVADPVTWLDGFLYPLTYYFTAVGALVSHATKLPALLSQGAMFAGSLLAVLAAHEAGHYIACRYYGVDATLPFFIPAPPLIFLPGTFGAFIKIRSPIRSRRALFDISVAGPLAGFAVILPTAIAALQTAQPALPIAPAEAGAMIVFNDPPLLRIMAHALGIEITNIIGNPFYFAAWIGLLVTNLNLMPVGQLDGGHTIYAIFGARVHKYLGRVAFISITVLALFGWRWHNAPSGFVYALLLLIMLRLRHPSIVDETEPLGRARTLIAVLTLIVFLLSFMPFPITII